MKAIATGTGLNSTALICLPNSSPRIAAGRKATNRFSDETLCRALRT